MLSQKDELVSQYETIGLPTEKELGASSNVVWVNDYYREDGTHVSGYWRSKGVHEEVNEGAGVNQGVDANYSEPEMNKPSHTPDWIKDGTLTGAAVLDRKENEGIIDPIYSGYAGSKTWEEQQIQSNYNIPTPEQNEQFKKDENVKSLLRNDLPEVAGVKRGEPMTFLEAVDKDVNRKWREEDVERMLNGDFRINGNCHVCVAAFEYCRRGYNVKASSTLYNNMANEMSQDAFNVWCDSKTNEPAEWSLLDLEKFNSFNYFIKTLKQGERYVLGMYPQLIKGDPSTIGGHVVIIEKNNNGEILIFDPQSNDIYFGNKEAKSYLNSWLDDSKGQNELWPIYLRIDDKQLNSKYYDVFIR